MSRRRPGLPGFLALTLIFRVDKVQLYVQLSCMLSVLLKVFYCQPSGSRWRKQLERSFRWCRSESGMLMTFELFLGLQTHPYATFFIPLCNNTCVTPSCFTATVLAKNPSR